MNRTNRTYWTAAAFVALGIVTGWTQPLKGGLIRPDTLSRSFYPPRYRIANPQARARIRAYFQRQKSDSSDYSFQDNLLRLNGNGLRRLTTDSTLAAAGPYGQSGETSRQRARRSLEKIAGTPLEEDPVYSSQDYLPDDLALQSTPQWGVRNDGSLSGSVPGLDLGMTKVWEKFDGDDSIIIAVLDAGINFYHPDLQGRWFVNQAEAKGQPGIDDDHNGFIDDSVGWDFVDKDNRPQDSHGHGTFLSGVIAAKYDNGIGVAGMLPRARILPVRVLATTGDGYSSDIAAGMRYAVKMGASVINFSIGIGSNATDTALQNAFKFARDNGVIVSAAAANDTRNLDADPRPPASYKYSNVYMVASHGPGGQLSGFSNYGATSVDLAAPGENIVTTCIPPAIIGARETFEAPLTRWKLSTGFAVGADTLEGNNSLRLTTGTRQYDTATWDSLDLRGRSGGVVSFMLDFKQGVTGTNGDWVYVDTLSAGGTVWKTLSVINTNVTGRTTLTFNLGSVDGKLFKLRFRTDFLTKGTGAGTATLRIDDVRIKYLDENPLNQANYVATGGTSLAAPYVTAYAALMKVACARSGVPFTRALMLAGAVPDSFLVGKVITGGRLNVAKGLDFYLRTLPSLTTADSTVSTWPKGTSVHYTLGVRDTLGQTVGGYSFFQGAGTAAGSLTGPEYTWNQGSQTGTFTARFRAENPPLVLRRQIQFALTAGPVALSQAPGLQAVLRVGNREFLLPASALQGEGHWLRLELYGPDGRARQIVTGALHLPPGARSTEYRLSGISGVGLRAWLDGAPLQSAP